MHARSGDQIIIRGHRGGEPDRDGRIVEVHGSDGGPPYVVRWSDSGHETLVFPGSDAVVQHLTAGEG
jgi:hypothetical protein